jgi:hypothetical protein
MGAAKAWDPVLGAWVYVGRTGAQGPPGAQGIQGEPGPQGPAGASGSASFTYTMSALTDADVDPGAGHLTIENTGGSARRLAISETDGTGATRNPGVLQVGDVITLSYDSDGVPPADSVARYTITQVPADMGTWWKFDTLREVLVGAPSVPPAGAMVLVLATLMAADLLTTQKGDDRYVNQAGDTMTGPLYLSGDPTVPAQAATKRYADGTKSLWTIVSGWADYAAPYSGLYVTKVGGLVTIEGLVMPTADWTPDGNARQIGTLPPGYLPSHDLIVGALHSTATGYQVGALELTSSGLLRYNTKVTTVVRGNADYVCVNASYRAA